MRPGRTDSCKITSTRHKTKAKKTYSQKSEKAIASVPKKLKLRVFSLSGDRQRRLFQGFQRFCLLYIYIYIYIYIKRESNSRRTKEIEVQGFLSQWRQTEEIDLGFSKILSLIYICKTSVRTLSLFSFKENYESFKCFDYIYITSR